jgi:hypothetical protein
LKTANTFLYLGCWRVVHLICPDFITLQIFSYLQEELPELEKLSREACPHDVKGGIENKHGKANILMQVGRGGVPSPSPSPSWQTSVFLSMTTL